MSKALARAQLSLYYDVVSPYTHIALHTWRRYCKLWKLELHMRPVFLGGIMVATKNTPPGMLPAKGAFLRQDLYRAADAANIPLLETPSNFFSEVARKVVNVQRVLAAAELHEGVDATQHLRLARAFSDCMHADAAFRSGDTLPVDDASFKRLVDTALERSGLPAQTILELAVDEAAKARLKANTEEAVGRGAFGSPTLFATDLPDGLPKHSADGSGELMVFGSDRMEQTAHILGLPYHGPNPGRYKPPSSFNAP